MKKHIFILAICALVMAACNYEDDISEPNYITFETDAVNLGVAVNSTASYDLTIYSGNTTGGDRTFEVSVDEASTMDASAYSVPSTFTIPGGSNEGVLTIDVEDYASMGLSGETIDISLVAESGLSVGEPVSITVSRTCPGEEFNVSFVFDGYASEVEWSVLDADGNALITQSGYSDGDSTASKDICLSSGDYTFTVTDSYGDGLTYPETGSITLSYAGEEITTISGDYGTGTSYDFSL